MLFDRSIDRLEYAMLFLVRFGWNPDEVQRLPIALIVLPDTSGQLFADFVPEPFNPLPELRTDQRHHQVPTHRKGYQFRGGHIELVNPFVISAKLPNFAALRVFIADVESGSLQGFQIATDASLMERTKP